MLIFIDESGNFRSHRPLLNNTGERFCTLVAIIIDDGEYKNFKKHIHALKDKYERYIHNKEIKSRSIRRSNPKEINTDDPPLYDFWKYGDVGKRDYNNFCNELEKIVTRTNFEIISVSVDKVIAQSLYPHKNIFSTMMTDLWERIYICHDICKIDKSRIFFDPQMSLSDTLLKDTYTNFTKSGSWFIKSDEITRVNLYKNIFSPNSETSCGIQLADYCAYPIKRFMEAQKYVFYERVIHPKLHIDAVDKIRNKTIFMGLKLSLRR